MNAIEAMKITLPILYLSAKAPKSGLTASPSKGKMENMSPTPIWDIPNCLHIVGMKGIKGASPVIKQNKLVVNLN